MVSGLHQSLDCPIAHRNKQFLDLGIMFRIGEPFEELLVGVDMDGLVNELPHSCTHEDLNPIANCFPALSSGDHVDPHRRGGRLPRCRRGGVEGEHEMAGEAPGDRGRKPLTGFGEELVHEAIGEGHGAGGPGGGARGSRAAKYPGGHRLRQGGDGGGDLGGGGELGQLPDAAGDLIRVGPDEVGEVGSYQRRGVRGRGGPSAAAAPVAEDRGWWGTPRGTVAR